MGEEAKELEPFHIAGGHATLVGMLKVSWLWKTVPWRPKKIRHFINCMLQQRCSWDPASLPIGTESRAAERYLHTSIHGNTLLMYEAQEAGTT